MDNLILYNKDNLDTDIEAVITSFNQGSMIFEAVHSLCTQTSLPKIIIIIVDALLGIEAISNSRLYLWETEFIHSIINNQELSKTSKDFIHNPSYGDGGMASSVRIVSIHK